MKKYISLIALLLCLVQQVRADQIQVSATLPSEGIPEHLYTMKSGNNYYANGTTSPTQTEANRALFAFYQSEAEGAYYIYCYTSNKWLGYTKSSGYNNGKGFIVLSDTKTEGAYFKCNNYSGDNYDIAPYNTTGVASKYLNWYQGVNDSANPLDGTVTLGLWQDNGSSDAGSRWVFSEVFPPISLSTTLPSEGTPEHLYTMKSGNDYYANGTTSPTQTEANRALFAFYQSEAEGAYYIYCYTSNKWLGYTKSSGYSNGRGFIVLSDTKTEGAYFKCNNYSGDNYDIAPYNTTGVASKYLNWYQNVSNTTNPLDGTVTLGLWEQNGAADNGSRWIFEEVALSNQITVGGIIYNLNYTAHTAAVARNSGITGSVSISETVKQYGISYTVTAIGENAFKNCTGLTSITIPNSVTSLGDDCFRDCTGLTSITIPNSVTSLGGWCFINCTGLTSITIPNSVTSLGRSCFVGCTGLTSITIPNSVTSLGMACFVNCARLERIEVESGNTVYNSRENCNAIIETSSNTMIAGCKNTKIPNSVTSLGILCFRGCTGLTSITIPNSVTSLGDYCFYDCTGLTSITIPNSVTSLGDSCFYDCTGLTSIAIPNSVTSLGISCFKGCTGLTSITIPNSVTSLGSECFRGCTGLTSITIPNSVTSLRILCFSDCTGLTSITIPNSVTSLGQWCFSRCTGLTSITIPNSVTSLGRSCFEYCTGLTNIKMKSSTPPSTHSEAFSGCSSLTTVYVPEGAKSAYNVEPWYNYEIVEFLDALNISDNGSATYAQAEDVEKDEINYTRNYAHTGWQALYVPFDIPYDEISDNFDVAELNDVHQFDDDGDGAFDRTELEVLRLKAGDVIAHNTPYVIRAKAAGEHTIALTNATLYKSEAASLDCSSLKYRYVFQGTYSGVGGSDMYSNGYYSFSEGTLRKAASASAALGGFRWYVSVEDLSGTPVSPAALPAKMRIVENEGGEATGIAAAPTTAPLLKDAPVYDLNGRRVGTADAMDALPKGVYIVNGKKVMK